MVSFCESGGTTQGTVNTRGVLLQTISLSSLKDKKIKSYDRTVSIELRRLKIYLRVKGCLNQNKRFLTREINLEEPVCIIVKTRMRQSLGN